MDDLYREQILEHAKHPRNFGHLDAPTATRDERNPLCGDQVRIELLIADDHVADIRFNGRGCAISQASASLLTEAVKGMDLATARAFGKEELLELIGIPLSTNPTRLKCALLALKAFKTGLYSVDSDAAERNR